MESVVAALVTGVLTLIGALVSNSRSRAVMEVEIDNLTRRDEKHNCLIERTYALEQDVAVAKAEIDNLRTGVAVDTFLTSNEWQWRLLRTVVQGVLGVIVANIGMLVGCAVMEPTWRTVVALVMTELGTASVERKALR